jgi:hypothetical protein
MLAFLLALHLARPAVFLSYARADLPDARRVHARLTAAGCRVWWDRGLQPGDRWASRIERALDAADAVVILVGVSCQSCRDEIHRALRKRKRVIPYLLRANADLPLPLEQFQRATLGELEAFCRGSR